MSGAARGVFVPTRTGAAALDELAQAPWDRLKHAFGAGPLIYMGYPFDVAASLRDIVADDPEKAEEALLSFWDTLCHQGTIYEASAWAIPFLIAFLVDVDADDPRGVAVAGLLASISAAACLPEPPHGSQAGAWGRGVRALTRGALAASFPHLEELRRRQPRQEALVSLLQAAARLTGDDQELARQLEKIG